MLVAGTALRAPGAERLVAALRGAAQALARAGQPAGRPRPRPRDRRAGARARRAGGDGGLLAAAVRGATWPSRARRWRSRASSARRSRASSGGWRAASTPTRRRPRRRCTDPGEAAAFVAATGVDCLAVAVGNVHGALLPAPRALDWARLAEIRRAVDVPLALHGGDRARRRGRAARAARGRSPRSTSTRRCAAPIWRATAARPGGARAGRRPGRAARAPGARGRGRRALDPRRGRPRGELRPRW